MKNIRLVFIMIFSVSFLFPVVKNMDRPLKGEWDFNLKKIWEIDHAGDILFASAFPILASGDGHLYVLDPKNKTHYIFDKNGRFLKTFAPQGEGPGEIRRMDEEAFFLVKDTVILADPGKVNYYDKTGEYIESALNYSLKRMPQFFINEDEYIYAPIFAGHMPNGRGEITRYNLKTGEEKVLAKFSLKPGERAAMILFPLTPTMVLGGDSRRLYYGLSNSYRIGISDLRGNKSGAFSLERQPGKVKKEYLKKFLSQWGDPPDQVDRWVKTMPTTLTLFDRIEVHNGLIFVFKTQFGPRAGEDQQIDIFSPQGNYLYRSFIRPGNGLILYMPVKGSMVIKSNHLYMAVQNPDGERQIVKYEISLPTG